MVTKWKGWTARRPVKIICAALIPVMAFVILCGVVGLARMNIDSVSEDMLFTDFEDNSYFFDRYAYLARVNAQNAFSYQSEDHMRGMGCLEWQAESYYYSPDETEGWMRLVSENLAGRWQEFGSVRASDIEGQEARQILENAVSQQIDDYLSLGEWLETTSGLYYYVTDGERVLTNAPEQDADSFLRHPVYLITENGRVRESSRQGDYTYYDPYSYDDYGYKVGLTVRIAFSQQAVDAQNAEWKTAQRQFSVNIAIMAAPALAALLLLAVLTVGAGRRPGADGVCFTALDKPWADLGLVVLIGYETALCCLIFYCIEAAWRYGNLGSIYLLCALLAVGFTLPLIRWLQSFAKRCKAGKWWRHTLVYWIYDKCRSFIKSLAGKFKSFTKSLWAGFPLTVKAVLTAIAVFAAMVFCAAMPHWNFPLTALLAVAFTAALVLLLLRYARRLHLVEQGARAAGGGRYDTPIEVGGGELGSIADSINRISDGINSAVAERMKSERLKTELITNVSHDIRTPLTSLITYTDLLKSEGLNSERAPEYLEVLIQKSARLKTLTDDLFEASKAASGNIEVRLEALDLADFVRQVLGELDERVSASGLDFRVNLPEHAMVRADGKLLWRVMENLLSNVFKYAMKGSRVYIEVVPENGDYRLELKNISEHPLNVDPYELTERFKRGDSARTDEGSGLGLSISQSFIQAQGGRFALNVDGDLFKVIICLPKEGIPPQ